MASANDNPRATFLDPLKSDAAAANQPGQPSQTGQAGKKDQADMKTGERIAANRKPATPGLESRDARRRDTKPPSTKPPSKDPESTNRVASDRPSRRPRSSGRRSDREASSPTPSTDTVVPTTAARSRAKRANIRLSGPAIGTAPHYLSYSVSLPQDTIEGADFLWMDNGVWIGDEPRGVKILDTPGLHRISVLIITKNNQEYRGSATVQVLERRQAHRGDLGDR